GGVDGANGTALALGALDALDSKGSFVDVVIGARHPDRDGIVEHCRNQGYLCHVQTSEIANLMDAADLAIGAGGASSWERCIVGLPTVIVVTAENQALIATELAERGAAVNLGPIATVSATMIADNIHGLQQDPRRLKQMSQAAYGLLNDRTDVSELIYRGC
ncbi:glycosyltransferase, partial [Polaromonas sp.]|uniref:glycosyltransferase n=1 Tax=Polaromonas sp. TaxID=1869339 RepID=UPI0035612A2A